MSGPQFLFVYAGVIAAVLAAGRRYVLQHDRTLDAGLPLVPEDPDPYAIAYLRSGVREVVRLAVFNLIQRGYLQFVESITDGRGQRSPRQILRAIAPPDPDDLPRVERLVYDSFVSPRMASQVFDLSLIRAVQASLASVERKLRDEQLLCPETVRRAATIACTAGVALILGLGGFRLVSALLQGHHNVLFLVAMAAGATAYLIVFCRPPRLSRRGWLYLRRLQAAFDGLRRTTAPHAAGVEDATVHLLVSLFGVTFLADTSYSYFEEMFHPAGGSDGWKPRWLLPLGIGASVGGSRGGGSGWHADESGCGGGGGGGGGHSGCGGCGHG